LSQNKNIINYLILSTIGAALIVIIILLETSNIQDINNIDKLLISIAFVLSCVFGISLAIKPNWIQKISNRNTKPETGLQTKTKSRERQGHHPNCNQFKSHTIQIKNKIHCAGCIGLLLGGIISIVLVVIYLAFLSEIPFLVFQIFIISGFALISFNYLEIKLPVRNPRIHFVSNTLLIIAFLFVVIGMFHLTGNVLLGIFGVLFSFLWLDTRIQLSEWHHQSICKNCIEDCKEY
jgi:hypothetical protein